MSLVSLPVHGPGAQMSEIIHVGPLALAADRLIATAAVWLFVAVGAYRRMAGDKAAAVSLAAAGGFLVARLFYVATHFADFRKAPAAILEVWQGGFQPLAGILAAGLILAIAAPAGRRLRLIALLIAVSGSWYAVDRLLTTAAKPPFAVPAADLTTLVGDEFDPAALKGRPYVVNLWADWCPPCRREMPLLAAAARAHPEVSFLFVNQGDPAAIARKLPATHRIDEASVLLDSAARLSGAYGGALPTTLFVGTGGDVRSVHAGEISAAALSDKIKLIEETRP